MTKSEIEIYKDITYAKRRIIMAMKEMESIQIVPKCLMFESDKATLLVLAEEIRIVKAEIEALQKKLKKGKK